jgi:hypothetical protein
MFIEDERLNDTHKTDRSLQTAWPDHILRTKRAVPPDSIVISATAMPAMCDIGSTR